MNNACETKESCIDKMIKRLKGLIPQIIGSIMGGVGGFIYYFKVGCISGTCPITSNPWLSILWGAIMGFLLVDIFNSKRK
jgi:hypothetical protein